MAGNLVPLDPEQCLGSSTTRWKDMHLKNGLDLHKNTIYVNDNPVYLEKDLNAPINELYGCGRNIYGMLGLGHTTNQLSPIKLNTTKWKYVSCSTEHMTALSISDSTWYGWGANTAGQLGLGNTLNQYTPLKLNHQTKWKRILNAPWQATYAFTYTNDLYVWGRGDTGQLGLGTSTHQYTPIKISDTKWKIHMPSEPSSGTVLMQTVADIWYGWGGNGNGELGIGFTNQLYVNSQLTPLQLNYAYHATKWKTLRCTNFTLATDENDKWYGWGNNNGGQLGLGHYNTQLTPILLPHLNNKKQVHNCLDCTLYISENDELWGNGYPYYGQLGLGHTNNVLTPIKLNNSKWKKIRGNSYTIFAQTIDDVWYGWGWNSSGHLGLGHTNEYQLTPVKVSDTKWSNILSNYSYTIFLL